MSDVTFKRVSVYFLKITDLVEHMALPSKHPTGLSSYTTAFLGPQIGSSPSSFTFLSIDSVGLSVNIVAIPVVQLPPNGSNIVSPIFEWHAIKIASASGEIFVGYEKALNNAPVLVEGNGELYNISIDLLITIVT